jgi:hypothetical protein
MPHKSHGPYSTGYATAQSTATSLTGRSTRTPLQAMPSAFSWPVVVPSALRATAPVN